MAVGQRIARLKKWVTLKPVKKGLKILKEKPEWKGAKRKKDRQKNEGKIGFYYN